MENIHPSFGSSFYFSQYARNENSKAHVWHYHPEIELVYVNGGSGRRQIGSHVSYYADGDLILIGSNLPHCGFTNEETNNKTETVIQMRPDFLGSDFFDTPEALPIKALFARASAGIAFNGKTKQQVGQWVEAMQQQDQFGKLVSILQILNTLEQSSEATLLNAGGFAIETPVEDQDRMSRVLNYIKDHYKDSATVEAAADLCHMTVPAFCRYFKQRSKKTFTQMVNEYRLVHASKLLAEQTLSITEICFACGFNNFSHFNKSFKAFTGQSASGYRQAHKKFIG